MMCAVCYSDSWEFHSQGVTNLDGWDGAESEDWRHFGGGGRLGDCCKYGVVELKADERQRRGCWCPLPTSGALYGRQRDQWYVMWCGECWWFKALSMPSFGKLNPNCGRSGLFVDGDMQGRFILSIEEGLVSP